MMIRTYKVISVYIKYLKANDHAMDLSVDRKGVLSKMVITKLLYI